MVELNFQNFSFRLDGEDVITTYADRYFFTTPLTEFTDVDHQVTFDNKTITFPNISEKKADNKLNRIIDKGLHNLIHKINKKKVIYIDEATEIPLIGAPDFGIIDRNTNILEIKPLTGCNLNCIYCSVDEGINNKTYDILIDPYYLAQEASKIAATKEHLVEFNIGPHAEPLLYPFILELIEELYKIPNCDVISINTNGTILSKPLLDDLKKAGLTRVNLSLNTLDKKKNDELSGKAYPLSNVLNMIEYCKDIDLAVLIAPLIVPGYNDNEKDVEDLVKLAKTIPSKFPTIGFQKFLSYKGGRNPVEEQSFDEFFELLKPFEEKYDITLTPKKDYNPFGIYEDTKLEKPLKKNEVVKAIIVSPGRVPKETLCTAKGRVIVVRGLGKTSGTALIKIVRDKHNIYLGVPAK